MNISKVINSTIKALLTLFLCLSFTQAHSQKLLWQRQYGDSHFVHISTVLPQPDNSVIIAGYFKDRLQLGDYQMSSSNDNASHIACFLAKITTDSVVRWATKVIDGAIVKDMKRDGKGDFYLACLMLNESIVAGDDTIKSFAPHSSFILKCSAAQIPLWANTTANLPDSAAPLNITFDQNEMIFVWGNYKDYNDKNQFHSGRWGRGIFASFYRKDSGKIFYSRTSFDSNYRVHKVIYANNYEYAFIGVKIPNTLYKGKQAENLMIQKLDLGSNPIDSILFERSSGLTFSDACADNNGNIYMSGILSDTLIMQGHYFIPKPGGQRNMLTSITTGLSLNWLNTDTSLSSGAPTTLAFNRKKNRVAMIVPHNGNFGMAGKAYTGNDIGYLYTEADSFNGKIDYIKPVLKSKIIAPNDYTGRLAIDTGGNFFYVMNFSSSVDNTNTLSTVKGVFANNLKDKNNKPVPAFLTCWFTNDTVNHNIFNSVKPLPKSTEAIKLYPNPAQNILILSQNDINGAIQLNIRDLQGRCIINQSTHISSGDFIVNISSLAAGMYIIDMQAKDRHYVGRFVKN